jgi:hypothetical protein
VVLAFLCFVERAGGVEVRGKVVPELAGERAGEADREDEIALVELVDFVAATTVARVEPEYADVRGKALETLLNFKADEGRLVETGSWKVIREGDAAEENRVGIGVCAGGGDAAVAGPERGEQRQKQGEAEE